MGDLDDLIPGRLQHRILAHPSDDVHLGGGLIPIEGRKVGVPQFDHVDLEAGILDLKGIKVGLGEADRLRLGFAGRSLKKQQRGDGAHSLDVV